MVLNTFTTVNINALSWRWCTTIFRKLQTVLAQLAKFIMFSFRAKQIRKKKNHGLIFIYLLWSKTSQQNICPSSVYFSLHLLQMDVLQTAKGLMLPFCTSEFNQELILSMVFWCNTEQNWKKFLSLLPSSQYPLLWHLSVQIFNIFTIKLLRHTRWCVNKQRKALVSVSQAVCN